MTKNRSNYVNKIEVLSDGLKVSFANNSEDTFPNLWLRDHAKDENNWDERSHQRKTFTAKINPLSLKSPVSLTYKVPLLETSISLKNTGTLGNNIVPT